MTASFVGCSFGFFEPAVVFLIIVIATSVAAVITETFNEYQCPLPDSSFLVQDSTIPDAGMGLFAATFIEKGSYLFDYTGEILTEDDYFYRYPEGNGQYVARIITGLLGGELIYIDGIDPSKLGLARNSNSQEGSKANLV